jgi:hypothetical protein
VFYMRKSKANLYKVDSLHKVPVVAGVYAWYFSFNDTDDFQKYHYVFKHKKLNINAKGVLGENYFGNLFIDRSKSITQLDGAIDKSLLKLATEIFCPPVYIGISDNLNKRLFTHFDKLRSILHSSDVSFEVVDVSPIEEAFYDSDVESEYFAKRVASVLRKLNHKRLSNFFIKTIEIETKIHRADLLKIEKILNHTYNPLYGKR